MHAYWCCITLFILWLLSLQPAVNVTELSQATCARLPFSLCYCRPRCSSCIYLMFSAHMHKICRYSCFVLNPGYCHHTGSRHEFVMRRCCSRAVSRVRCNCSVHLAMLAILFAWVCICHTARMCATLQSRTTSCILSVNLRKATEQAWQVSSMCSTPVHMVTTLYTAGW